MVKSMGSRWHQVTDNDEHQIYGFSFNSLSNENAQQSLNWGKRRPKGSGEQESDTGQRNLERETYVMQVSMRRFPLFPVGC